MALFDRFSNSDNSEMTFIDHLEVLRGTIVRSLSAVLIASLVLFIYRDWIMDNVITGPINPDFITYRIFCQLSHFLHLGDSLCMPPVKVSMQSTTFGGQFLSSISMAIVGGIITAFPFIFYQFWSFIKPALKENELRNTRFMIFWVSFFFFLGAAFGFFILGLIACVYWLSPESKNTSTQLNQNEAKSLASIPPTNHSACVASLKRLGGWAARRGQLPRAKVPFIKVLWNGNEQ